MGRGGPGRSGGNAGRGQEVKGTVRWESAKPIIEAVKTPLPSAFAGHYVVSLNGLPDYVIRREQRSSRDSESADEDSRSTSSDADSMEHLKYATSLIPKNGSSVQPGIVLRQPSSSKTSLLFGFSRELLPLSLDEKEVLFVTRLRGTTDIRVKFELHAMKYRGELAL